MITPYRGKQNKNIKIKLARPGKRLFSSRRFKFWEHRKESQVQGSYCIQLMLVHPSVTLTERRKRSEKEAKSLRYEIRKIQKFCFG